MSNPPRRRRRRRIHPIIKFLFSVAAIGLMLYLANFAFKYCLGLFMVGEDYVVQLPGQESPVVEEMPPEGTAPVESDTIVEVGRATVLSAGDLMTHLPIVRSGKISGGYDHSYIFQYLTSYVSAADYAVVNLETTLSGTDGKEYTGYPKFNAPDSFASAAYLGGFDMMLTANNHCYDYGTEGMLRTLNVVKEAGLETLGVVDQATDEKYIVKELNGIRIGMINYTFSEINDDRNTPVINGIPTKESASGLINAFDYDNLDMFYSEVENYLSAMKSAGAEATVLFIHWGDEYTTNVNDNQRAIAQKMCELGVDVIVGSHPHVVQTMELLHSNDGSHQTVCVYSLGNFLSNQRATNIDLTTGQSEDSVLFSFTFVEYSDGSVRLEDIRLLPTWVLIRGSGDGRTYYVLPLDESLEDWAAAFELSGSQSSDAKASLSRTKQIIWSDYETIRSTIAQQAADHHQALGIFTGGVG